MSGLISIRNLIRRDIYFGGRTVSYPSTNYRNSFMVEQSLLPVLTSTNITTADLLICDERRLGGIRGAKKKAGGSSTNGRNSEGRRLGIKVWPNQFASTS
jgi:hypothetical protein